MRGQYLGRIADYERADALAAELVRDEPASGAAHLAAAKAHALFHRFTAALGELDTAQRLGVRRREIDSQRAAIFAATGRYDEALEIRRRAAAMRPDITTLGLEAALRGERGEVDAAEQIFTEAQYHYRDVSPFPVAWLHFLQGQMWMREGNPGRARELFAAAHERLPAYATAQGHLAEVEALLGNRRRAAELLRPLAETSDDPDYAAQLARILADSGEVDESRRWRALAAARYEELISRHPEAFADHAAEFWLASGADAEKALGLAKLNLELRRTPRAYELVLGSALAAGDRVAACDAGHASAAIAHPYPGLRTVQARALATCAGAAAG
jgi:tetratricopeptide (TPR) repeat protein